MRSDQCSVVPRDFVVNPERNFKEFLTKLADIDYDLAKTFAFSSYFGGEVDENDIIVNCSISDFEAQIVPLFKQYLISWRLDVSGCVYKHLIN